jgi:hypothetical protein
VASAEALSAAAKTPLLLFHISQPDASPEQGSQPLTTRLLEKASDQWLKLGSKDKKSWMFWFYKRGESLMDRIEYEEWSLKGVHEGRGVEIKKPGQDGEQQRIEVGWWYRLASSVYSIAFTFGMMLVLVPHKQPLLIYQIALLKPTLEAAPLPTLLPKLHRMLIHRIPFHRKMMVRSLLL